MPRSKRTIPGHTGLASQAAALVVYQKMSRNAAAAKVGVDPAAVSRLLKKYTVTTTCPCCGHARKEIKL